MPTILYLIANFYFIVTTSLELLSSYHILISTSCMLHWIKSLSNSDGICEFTHTVSSKPLSLFMLRANRPYRSRNPFKSIPTHGPALKMTRSHRTSVCKQPTINELSCVHFGRRVTVISYVLPCDTMSDSVHRIVNLFSSVLKLIHSFKLTSKLVFVYFDRIHRLYCMRTMRG